MEQGVKPATETTQIILQSGTGTDSASNGVFLFSTLIHLKGFYDRTLIFPKKRLFFYSPVQTAFTLL